MTECVDVHTGQVYGFERCILIDTPFCTPEEYARRTGQSLSTVRTQLDEGVLPYVQPLKKKGSRRLVNLMQLAKEALEFEGQRYD